MTRVLTLVASQARSARAGWAIFLTVIGGVATAFGVPHFSQTGGGITPMLLLGIGLLLLSSWVRPDQPDRTFPPIPPRPDQVADSSREQWLPQGFVVERESRDWILGLIGSEAHTMSKRTGVLERWPSYPDALTRFTSRSRGGSQRTQVPCGGTEGRTTPVSVPSGPGVSAPGLDSD
jgi:hypothetical protein